MKTTVGIVINDEKELEKIKTIFDGYVITDEPQCYPTHMEIELDFNPIIILGVEFLTKAVNSGFTITYRRN